MELGTVRCVGTQSTLLVIVAAAVALLFGWSVPAANAALHCGDTITADKKLKKDLLNCPDDGVKIGASGVQLDLNGHKITGAGTDNSVGIEATASGVSVKGLGSIRNFDQGIRISNSDGSVVRKVDVRGGDDSIVVTESAEVTVKQNKVRNYRSLGISVINDTDTSLVERNQVIGPSDSDIVNTAITVVGGEDNVVRENVLSGKPESSKGILIRLGAVRTQLLSNEVTGFPNQGIHLYEGAAQTLVKGNVLKQNGWGIHLEDIAGPPTATKIVNNVANNNGINGIDLETNGSTVRKNTANGNDGWGILSTGTSVDQGGNKAKGNGQPGQCSGVACS